MQEDGSGQIWAGTPGGLRFCRDGKLVGDSSFGSLRNATISCLMRSRDGKTMWIGSPSYGLFSFHNNKLEPCIGPSPNEKIKAESLLEDSHGRLWVGIGNGTVLCRQTNQWQFYTETNGLPFAFVTTMTEDADGNIWAGSLDAGLYRLNGSQFDQISHNDGLSADDIRSLYCDRERNLWIGTRTGGLNRLGQRRLSVVSNAQGLTNNFTHSVAQTPDGMLWVGTTGGSVYRGTPAGFQAFRPEDIVYYFATVLPVLTAPDGSVWWGAASGLLHWKDNQLADCITNAPWVQSIIVTALQNDTHGGMWIGTSAGHLVHMVNGQTSEFPMQITRATITSLAVERSGSLWVGTVANGLKLIPYGSETVLSITNGLPAKASIQTLYLDPEGVLWIGTGGGGLFCRLNGRIYNFSPSPGLPAQTVSQIVEDDLHFLWLGCSHGIFWVGKADLLASIGNTNCLIHSRSFGINDGMLTEECSGGYCPAGLKLQNGLICISTVKGLVFLNPRKLQAETPPPRVMLEEAEINKTMQGYKDIDDSGQNPISGIPYQPQLTVAPAMRDSITIHYTAIGFSAPEKIGFRYKLEPLDSGWTDAGSQRYVEYHHLPPGDFTFHVEACNADGVWNEQDTILTITSKPFFWETALFRAAVSLTASSLFAAALWLVMRHRYKLRLARLQAINAIERERLRISKDMHDQVGGVLTQVSQLTDMGLNETSDENLVKKRLERIGNRARVAVQALDEIVWATNPKNDNLASFAEYISRFSDEFFEYTNVRCWQEMPATLPALPLRADIRHNVFLAVREALNNALRHSKCAEVWLTMRIDEGEVTVKIEDNGIGFVPKQTAEGGNGLGNMDARLAECDGRAILISTPGKGTCVTFKFPVKQ